MRASRPSSGNGRRYARRARTVTLRRSWSPSSVSRTCSTKRLGRSACRPRDPRGAGSGSGSGRAVRGPSRYRRLADGLRSTDLEAAHVLAHDDLFGAGDFAVGSSYQISTSTRRLSARPSGVVFGAIGWVASPAQEKAIDSEGRESARCRSSAISPARSRDRPSLSPKRSRSAAERAPDRPRGPRDGAARCRGAAWRRGCSRIVSTTSGGQVRPARGESDRRDDVRQLDRVERRPRRSVATRARVRVRRSKPSPPRDPSPRASKGRPSGSRCRSPAWPGIGRERASRSDRRSRTDVRQGRFQTELDLLGLGPLESVPASLRPSPRRKTSVSTSSDSEPPRAHASPSRTSSSTARRRARTSASSSRSAR